MAPAVLTGAVCESVIVERGFFMGREWKSDGRGGTITEGVDQAAVKRPPDMLKKAIPDGTVVLTFDDALRHHYTKVAPALEERGFGGTFYVSELYFPVYGADDYADGVKKGVYMTWEEIADLERRGFEIGNHSLRHANLPGMTQAEMKREIDGIAERCAAYRIPRPQTFAYPGLAYTADSVAYLRAQGYTFARTGLAEAYDPLMQHPLTVMGTDVSPDYEGFVEQVERAREGKIVVLLYHDVPDAGAFAKTMDYLKKRGFQALSMKRLEDYIDPEKAAAYFEGRPAKAVEEGD